MADNNPTVQAAADQGDSELSLDKQDATQNTASEPDEQNKSNRKRWLRYLAILLIVIAIIYGIWYFLVGSRHATTDNAYTNAESAQVMALVSGPVAQVFVSDTQQVQKGDLLVRLNPDDQKISLAKAEADYASAERKFGQTSASSDALSKAVVAQQANVEQAEANYLAAQSTYNRSETDYNRRRSLVESGAVSRDEMTAVSNALEKARAALLQSRAAVDQAHAAKEESIGNFEANQALIKNTTVSTNPQVRASKAALDQARLDSSRLEIRAPMSGVVTQRQIQVGQRVNVGTPIATIVPIDQIYVDANFKETQLGKVKVGQTATVKSDLYGGDVVYHGHVVGFSGGTGSAFSLIPAQNATGNWIKVVQRLPVRIALDPKELRAHPLRVGLSMEADIDLSSKN